jgi:uncharacterized membrane protein YhaH (DUF805 family)
MLFLFIVSVVLNYISPTIGGILGLATILPQLAVGARRLHDTGRSGWWQLLLITVIGTIILIVFWAQPSKS